MTQQIIIVVLIVIGLALLPYYLAILTAAFYSGKMSVLKKYLHNYKEDNL